MPFRHISYREHIKESSHLHLTKSLTSLRICPLDSAIERTRCSTVWFVRSSPFLSSEVHGGTTHVCLPSLAQERLAVAFVLTASAARAGLITPDSIPNPPSAVDSANGTQVYANNIVNTQYGGLGLNFSSGAAITNMNGVAVWAPLASGIVIPDSQVSGSPPLAGQIGYFSSLAGKFVSPGSSNPTTVSSLSVETIGTPGFFSMSVYGLNGQSLNIDPIFTNVIGPNGSQSWTFTGSGISSFSTIMIPPPVVSGLGTSFNPAWGVAEVSFTPTQATTPEPSSLVLAGLGALDLAARFGWRRVRTVA